MSEWVVSGQPPKQRDVVISNGEPVGYAQLTVSGTALALPTIPPNANVAMVVFENSIIRWRDDGTDPTGDVGMQLFPGSTLVLNSRRSITQFKVIKMTGESDATLDVSYYQK